jgi:hypothetical protein
MAAPRKPSSLHDLILAADDRPYEDVPVPEWGGAVVRVRGMSGTDRDAYEAKSVAVRKMSKAGADVEMRLADFRSKLLVKCLFDPETDERVFQDNEVQKLGTKSGRVIERLFELAGTLSGMSDDSEAEARGNSPAAPSGNSTSG